MNRTLLICSPIAVGAIAPGGLSEIQIWGASALLASVAVALAIGLALAVPFLLLAWAGRRP